MSEILTLPASPVPQSEPDRSVYIENYLRAIREDLLKLLTDGMADDTHRHSELSGSDGSPDPAVQVDATGNVGIGTTSPGVLLHVGASALAANRDTNYTTGAISDTVNGGQLIIRGLSPKLMFDSTGGGNPEIYLDTSNLRFFSGQSAIPGTQIVTFQSGGNVGIGTTEPQEKLAVAGNIVLPKTAGNGIKVDLTTPTYGWRDLKGKVTQRNTGASKPAHNTWFGGLKQYQFAAGKEEYFTFHIDHDQVPASDIFLHVHWSHIGAFVTGGTITLEYEISYAKGFSQGAFGTPVSTTFAGTASTVQRDHVISEIQISATTPDANQIDSDDLEPDGIIECRVKVTSNDITVSEGAVPDPFIHEADIHYQSTGMGTKQKAPDFYT